MGADGRCGVNIHASTCYTLMATFVLSLLPPDGRLRRDAPGWPGVYLCVSETCLVNDVQQVRQGRLTDRCHENVRALENMKPRSSGCNPPPRADLLLAAVMSQTDDVSCRAADCSANMWSNMCPPSPQPGKLTEAFKYFIQGMGYSEYPRRTHVYRSVFTLCAESGVSKQPLYSVVWKVKGNLRSIPDICGAIYWCDKTVNVTWVKKKQQLLLLKK